MKGALHRLLRPYYRSLAAAIFLQALAGICSLIPWILLGYIAAETQPVAEIRWLWPITVSGLVWLFGQTLALYLTHSVDAGLCHQLRLALAEKLQRLPLNWFVHQGQDGVARYVEQDVRALHQLIAHAPTDLVNLLIVPLVAFGYLFSLNMSLALFALLPLCAAIGVFLAMRASRFRADVEQRDRTMEEMLESYGTLASHPVAVRQYPQAGVQAQAQVATDLFVTAFSHWVQRIGRLSAGMQLLLGAPLLGVWVIAGALGLGATPLPVAQLCVFLLLVKAIAAPLQAMGHGGDALRSARLAAERLNALLATPDMVNGTQQPDLNAPADIEVQALSFHYDNQPALQNITFSLPAGSVTAIVGPSGAGKSSLLLLLARFMDPDCGQIRVSGHPLASLSSAGRFQLITPVLQQGCALARPLDQNIALYRPDADQATIHAAAKAACLHEDIMARPLGYQSIPGQDLQLSGGELQRLSIARALLSPAPILLLDEPTSALDPQTAAALLGRLRQRSGTTVIVSHRLADVMDADCILVLERGQLVASGNHRQLLAAGGLYRRLWDSQGDIYGY
ncbi:ABC transporter ATP-binding protein [Serratia grimesii]|uniref:ABC transporter ATP-binding protein n=1 Tax=Serratia grimesii TaxID=82995 RepID=UPI00077C8C81|nr:ABC transporter ATP-binding protein [Serratia grimesii]CAI1177943.1 Iron import ATP-binding/permease protein IrtA [Serratia grimesii]CAI2431285.1 Iron import ATP-binding/permease protein IrtA [Serratia grimesii]SUI33913.1 Iron import ATP-binding/permease protein IrtA [Serratia grimesii]